MGRRAANLGRPSAAGHPPWEVPPVCTVGHSTRTLEELIALACQEPVALMCAEAVPWRCHRSLIADALLARGITVDHIIGPGGPGSARSHTLTAWARIDGNRVSYPGGTSAHGARPKTDRRESEGG